MEHEHKPIEPSIEHPINIKIPDECLDPDGGDCPCVKHSVKQVFNPI